MECTDVGMLVYEGFDRGYPFGMGKIIVIEKCDPLSLGFH